MQGLNRFLDLIPVNNETGNVTFTLNNFGIIALETSSLDQTEPGQAFSADLGPVTNAVSSSETIVTDQLLVTSKPISNVTGSISLQNLSSCVGSGSQRIAYSVFRTDALFLTPDTACTRFTVGSIILGVRVNNIRGCNATSVTVDMQQLEEVYICIYDMAFFKGNVALNYEFSNRSSARVDLYHIARMHFLWPHELDF